MVVLGNGTDINTDEQADVVLTPEARRQGVYVAGTTGTGKTTLLQNIAYQDMNDPKKPALIVLDPHGDFISDLLLRVPEDREDDVILFDPASPEQQERPLGLNLLSCDRTSPLERRLVVSTVVDTLRRLFAYSWGPRMEDLLRNAVFTLMQTENTTLLDLQLLLSSALHREKYTENVTDAMLRHFWEAQFASYNKQEVVEVVGSSLNKIGRFLVDPAIRNVIAQPQNSFDLAQIMDEGKILLVNLSKGSLGQDNSTLIGAVLVNLILIAALKRQSQNPKTRRPVHLIVDEFQNFATEAFPTLQSEARKYGIDLIVAHQYRDQLDDNNRGSTLNVANFLVMRVSGIDAQELATQFDNTPPEPEIEYQPRRLKSKVDPRYYERGAVDIAVKGKPRPYSDVAGERANQLAGLPNHTCRARLVDTDGHLNEYMLTTTPPLGKIDEDRANRIRARSVGAKTAHEVEKDIRRKIGDKLVIDLPPEGETVE